MCLAFRELHRDLCAGRCVACGCVIETGVGRPRKYCLKCRPVAVVVREVACCLCGSSFSKQGRGPRKYCVQCSPTVVKKHTGKCMSCGAESGFTSRGRNRKWCEGCAAIKKSRCRRSYGPYQCSECKVGFASGGNKRKFCSKQCVKTYTDTNRRFAFECEHCGVSFLTRVKRGRFCSVKCTAHGKSTRSYSLMVEGECSLCGEMFRRRVRNQDSDSAGRFCSQICTRNWQLNQKNCRRRASLAGVPREPIDISVLWERDKGVCQLCMNPIDRSLKDRDPMMMSVDHIVPLSKGGPHTIDNVQLAHFGCNARKCANMPDKDENECEDDE